MKLIIKSNDDSLNWTAKGEERIIQNVKNIIRTRQFEVPFMRALGISPDFIDSMPKDIKTDITEHIRGLIDTYEPRATVQSAHIESCDENGDWVISVELEV